MARRTSPGNKYAWAAGHYNRWSHAARIRVRRSGGSILDTSRVHGTAEIRRWEAQQQLVQRRPVETRCDDPASARAGQCAERGESGALAVQTTFDQCRL